MKRTHVAIIFVVAVAVALVSGALYADRGVHRLSASATSAPPAVMVPGDLPEITKSPNQNATAATKDGRAVYQLFWDDGTCEAGIGVGAANTAFMEFYAPTVCTQPGLSIIAVTARVNTLTASSFSLRQSGATPGAPASGTRLPLATAITGLGACGGSATTGVQRVLSTPGVVNGTANFYAGLVYPVGGYTGRDTGSALGHMFLNCATCGMSVYSSLDLPTTLRGNLVIRVTIDDAGCVPVELQSFAIE